MFVNGSGQKSTLHRGPHIDASYQVSVHLSKRFQRRRFLKIGQLEIVRVEGTRNLLFPNTQSISILLYRKTLDS
jgi:hypothetical protein